MARRENLSGRLRRLRRERGLSQRDLSAPGVSYAYVSRIEAGERMPSVRALRLLAAKLGVSVEYLETGEASALERGVIEAGLDFGSLSRRERGLIEATVDAAAFEAACRAAERVLAERRKAEAADLRKRLRELEGR